MVYILFVIGFVALIKGADWMVAGSASIAKKYNISDLVIGLTIVSMGTSMPELIVNVIASLNDSADIAIGNIIGSNISNILLILGVSAIIFPLAIKESTVISEIPYSMIAILLVAFVANTDSLQMDGASSIGRIDGVILLLFFILFITYIIKLARQGRTDLIEESDTAQMKMTRAIIYVVLGMACLFFGGVWVVDGAKEIASKFGMSEEMIGLTVVAIGTSLPELVTSAVAAYKKSTDIAVANVIGSNIFNLLWVLGVSAVIQPMDFIKLLNTDLIILLGASCLIIVSLAIGKANSIGKKSGVVFLLSYVAYIVYVVSRG